VAGTSGSAEIASRRYRRGTRALGGQAARTSQQYTSGQQEKADARVPTFP